MNEKQVILGVDPGLATTGIGVLIKNKTLRHKGLGQELQAANWQTIDTSPTMSLGCRLEKIYAEITNIINKIKPDLAAVEKLYFGKNAKTAMLVGQARGVIILACQQKNLNIREYTPLEIKVATCGYGRADKRQVQRMIKQLLNLKEIPKPDDAADALAVAYTAAVAANSKLIVPCLPAGRKS
ncbi:crossover junction endodeoxyribonuclease RuvC [Patescibacteria group bacterium]|nr:crossover junction endodeoxyribonuclease RuvC [Patescibacteria group bacterium]